MPCGCLPRLFRRQVVENCPLLKTVDSALAVPEAKPHKAEEQEDKDTENETSPIPNDLVKEEAQSITTSPTPTSPSKSAVDFDENTNNSRTPADSRKLNSPGRHRRNGPFFRNLFKPSNNSGVWDSMAMEKHVICELQVNEATSSVVLQFLFPTEPQKSNPVLKLSPSIQSLFRLLNKTKTTKANELEDSDLPPARQTSTASSSSSPELVAGLDLVRGKERSGIPCFNWVAPGAEDEDEEVRFSDKRGMIQAPPGLVGLDNLGNTCFLNAALQCLRCTPGFTNLVVPEFNNGFQRCSCSVTESSEKTESEASSSMMSSDERLKEAPRFFGRSHSFGSMHGENRCGSERDWITRRNSLPMPLPLEVGGILTGDSGLAGGSISRLSSVPNLSLNQSLTTTGSEKTPCEKTEEQEKVFSVNFISAFRKLMLELCLGDSYSWWSAHDLYQQLKKLPQGQWLCDGGQHDCQEILKVLLDTIHAQYNQDPVPESRLPRRSLSDVPAEDREELSVLELENLKAESTWKRYLFSESSPITDVFAGQLQIVRCCQKCHCRSTTYEPFWDLSLSLCREKTGWFNSGRMPNSLHDLLRAFTAAEVLQGDDAPFCEKCDQKSPATRRILVHRFPPILVLNIKRFKYTREGREKLTCGINFPMNGLRLQNFSSKEYQQNGGPAVYDLYAVSNHFGNLGGGHYTACCKVKDSSNKEGWFCFNDKRVYRVTEDSVSTPNAYILFYAKRQSLTN